MNQKHKPKKAIHSLLAAFLVLVTILQPVDKWTTLPNEPGISVCSEDPSEIDFPPRPDPPKPH